MKVKANATPKPTMGYTGTTVKLTQPNQGMSLQEILERFTRGETLAIGQPVQYHESDDDLEKVSHMDLVDKEEYIDKLKQTKKDYEIQERKKASKKEAEIRQAAIDKIAAEEKQKAAQLSAQQTAK